MIPASWQGEEDPRQAGRAPGSQCASSGVKGGMGQRGQGGPAVQGAEGVSLFPSYLLLNSDKLRNPPAP